MKLIVLLTFSIISSTVFSQTETKNASINWMSMQAALDSSAVKGNKKKIFIDAYTDWCGWCKKMDKSTFMDSTVIAYMNKHYFSVKFDAECQDTIIYKGQEFLNSKPGAVVKKGRKPYHVFAAALLDGQLSYPSYVIMDENQNRLAIYKGFMKTDPFLTVIKYFGLNQHQQYTQYLFNEFNKQQGVEKAK